MNHCPLCKTEDTNGYGYCRECGAPTTNTEANSEKPSQLSRVSDAVGSFTTQALATGITLFISSHIGAILGMLCEFADYRTAGIGIIKSAAFSMTAAAFALGWLTSPWLRLIPVCVGSILTALLMAGLERFFSNDPTINLAYWCSLAIVGITATVCGTQFAHNKRWYLLLIPVLWTGIVLVVMYFTSYPDGFYYDQMIDYCKG